MSEHAPCTAGNYRNYRKLKTSSAEPVVVRSIELLYSVTGAALWPALVAFVVTLHHSRRPNALAIAQMMSMSVFALLGYSISKYSSSMCNASSR